MTAGVKMSANDRLEKLERFFKEVASLAINHEVLEDTAVVYPFDLGEALSRVDPEWAKNTTTIKPSI